MLALVSSSAAFSPTVAPLAPTTAQRAAAPVMESVEDLKVLAGKLNPVVKYFNPLSLGESSVGSSYDAEAAIGYLRHAEIKHGRIAMAAFVGYIVQSNGIFFPWATTLEGTTYADISAAGSPAAQWDAVPTAAKLQIFGLIFLLELWGESASALAAAGEKHYMRGGKPGYCARRPAAAQTRRRARAHSLPTARRSLLTAARRALARRPALRPLPRQRPLAAVQPLRPVRPLEEQDARAEGARPAHRAEQRPPGADRHLGLRLRVARPRLRPRPLRPRPRLVQRRGHGAVLGVRLEPAVRVRHARLLAAVLLGARRRGEGSTRALAPAAPAPDRVAARRKRPPDGSL
jgi:hypothetical protein